MKTTKINEMTTNYARESLIDCMYSKDEKQFTFKNIHEIEELSTKVGDDEIEIEYSVSTVIPHEESMQKVCYSPIHIILCGGGYVFKRHKLEVYEAGDNRTMLIMRYKKLPIQ
ncbi:MAG: hypothetical protein WD554_07840 [Flavobacteriaceae bacterium]